MTIEPPKTLCDGRPGRSLSKALLAHTFVIALALGVLAASATMWVDLQREKNAVGNLAQDFMSSASPTAAAAVYNFDQAAAEQVAEGLFLERAITGIKIVNEGDVMRKANLPLQSGRLNGQNPYRMAL